MKVLGIVTGRPNGTTELLVKKALLGAQSKGAEIEMINIRGMDIRPCIGCNKCHDYQNAIIGYCTIQDDVDWIVSQIYDSDGLIVGMPAFIKTPPGEFKILMDRTGPGRNVFTAKMIKKMRDENPGKYDETKPVDERAFKKRFVSFIATGGSDRVQLTLPTMMGWCNTMGFLPMDKILIPWNFSVNTSDESLDRCFKSGEYIAECCATPEEEHEFYGDKGYCPVCHNDTFVLGPGTKCSCAVCGLNGNFEIQNGEFILKTTPEQIAMSNMLDTGRYQHYLHLSSIREKIKTVDWPKINARNTKILDSISTIRKAQK